MKNAVTITVSELKEMLLNWNFGAQPVSVQYVTAPKLTKDGKAKFGKVTKIANIGAMVGYKYENSVNNQRERENELKNFISQPLWRGAGKRLSTALSTNVNSGKFYMSYKMQKSFRAFHFDEVLNFIPVALLKPFFPASNYASQGVDRPVYHREISLENVKKLKFRKTTYNVVAG